jgi:hypothetical protein
MQSTFADQLAGLDLAGFTIGPPPVTSTDLPVPTDASRRRWSACGPISLRLLVDTALEADAEDIGWGLVNLFHRAAQRKSSAVDRATDEVRALVATKRRLGGSDP